MIKEAFMANTLLSEQEIKVIQEMRNISWGKLTVTIKAGKVVMITPAPDYKMSKD